MAPFKPLDSQFVSEATAFDVGAKAMGSIDVVAVSMLTGRQNFSAGALLLPPHLRALVTTSAWESANLNGSLDEFFEVYADWEEATEEDLEFIGAEPLLALYREARDVYHDPNLSSDERDSELERLMDAGQKIILDGQSTRFSLGQRIKSDAALYLA